MLHSALRPVIDVTLKATRSLLTRVHRALTPMPASIPAVEPAVLEKAAQALRQLDMPDEDSRRYLEKHVPRLSRTLTLVPPPQQTGRILELGCYMQITPLLQHYSGYREVRGGYFGTPGKTDHKSATVSGKPFSCYVDHFNAERDPFPYPDNHFDCVLAGEIVEHLLYDPMFMLLESRRVLAEGGRILLTTPNVASLASLGKVLDGRYNPQIYALYEKPQPGGLPDIGHMREYTAWEAGDLVRAAGFEVEALFTEPIAEYENKRHLLTFLQENGYSTENRGEQTYCIGVKRESLPVDRYPWWLYT